nr:hypothetical protein [Nocardioides ungokensis]
MTASKVVSIAGEQRSACQESASGHRRRAISSSLVDASSSATR